MELPALPDATSPVDLDLTRSNRWSSSGHELSSIISPPELVNMSELDGLGFEASLSASGLGAGIGGYDTTFAPLDAEISSWDMDLDGDGRKASIASTKSSKPQMHPQNDPIEAVVAHHTRDDGMSREMAGSDSRITITIDHAEPDTVLGVMQVLVQSRAKVQLHRG